MRSLPVSTAPERTSKPHIPVFPQISLFVVILLQNVGEGIHANWMKQWQVPDISLNGSQTVPLFVPYTFHHMSLRRSDSKRTHKPARYGSSLIQD